MANRRIYAGPPKHKLALPLDIDKEWDEFVWDGAADEQEVLAAKAEMKAWFKRAKRISHAIGKKIAKEQERERRRMLRAALKKKQEFELELVVAAQEERIQLAIVKDYAESRKACTAYVEKLRAAMQAQLKAEAEKEAAWRAERQKKLDKINRQMAHSKFHDERMALIARGVLRGRR